MYFLMNHKQIMNPIKKVNKDKKQYNIEWGDFLKYEWCWTI